MNETGNVFHKFFSKRKKVSITPDPSTIAQGREKEALSFYLKEGEKILREGSLEGIGYFEAAIQLAPKEASTWERLGEIFYHFGKKEAHEKGLLFSAKCCKTATSIEKGRFGAWIYWGKSLFELGKLFGEYHYFLEAKKKFHEAFTLCEKEPKELLWQHYWELGLLGTHIAEHSKEAVDVRMAIDAFRNAMIHIATPTPQFWVDFGYAYLQMGLLINDTRFYLQAIEHFKKGEGLSTAHLALASAYKRLYSHTLDEEYFTEANRHFSKVDSNEDTFWILWGDLLGESGKINKDPLKIKQAIEKYAGAKKEGWQLVEPLALLGSYTGHLDAIVEAEEKILHLTDQNPEDPDLWYAYGSCLIAYAEYYNDPNFYDLAIEKLQQGLSLDRTNAKLWHQLGFCHSRIGWAIEEEEPLQRSLKFFAKASDLRPNSPLITYDYALALYKLAEITSNLEVLEQGIQLLETLLQSQKNALLYHPEWLFYYAASLDLLGDHLDEENYYIRAIEVFSQVLLIDPDYPNIHYKIALTFAHLGELTSHIDFFHRSLNYFKLAIKEDEENEEIYLEWGLTLINLAHNVLDSFAIGELYREAELKIIRAGQLGNQHAYYHLACLYSLTTRPADAMYLLEKALKLDVLPPIEELLQDEWLEGVRITEPFTQFLTLLESRQSPNG